jgi:hypothetical protein
VRPGSGSQETPPPPTSTIRDEDPERSVVLENTTRKPGSVKDVPVWSWAALALFLLVAFAVLFDNGALLTPFIGEAATANNYLHAFFHDGRHLLAVPCH